MTPEKYTEIITETCNETYEKKEGRYGNKRQVYWWTAEIAEARKECTIKKRILTRINKRHDATEEEKAEAKTSYKEQRKRLKKSILKSKQKAWENIIEEVNNDIWGTGYKIVTKSLHTTSREYLAEEKMEEEAKKLFPRTERIVWTETIVDTEEIPLFTENELMEAIKRMKLKKAPGPDLLLPEIIQAVVLRMPEVCLGVMNGLLTKGEFPRMWKTARLVLIQKPRKDNQTTTSYRPLCLLNVLGKLLEQLLKERQQSEIEQKGGLSDA